MYFFALSQAPPALESITASSWPVRIEPARNAPSASAPRKNPAITGLSTARSPGVISSRSDGGGALSTTRARADVHDAAVVRLLGVVHDPRMVAELVADLDHDLHRGAAHGADRQ